MSTHRISASGDRQVNLVTGGGSFGSWSVPAKDTDGVTAMFGAFGEIRMLLPANGVRLERVKDESGSIYNILVLKAEDYIWQDKDGNDQHRPQSTTVQLVPTPLLDDEGNSLNSIPHTSVDIRRPQEDIETSVSRFVRGRGQEPVETIDLAVPPTEPVEEYTGPCTTA